MKLEEDRQRHLAAHHEAGHAIAAVMRGGSSLRSVSLDSEHHGAGITYSSHKPADDWFITWAGPWTEARFQWGDRPLDDLDEDGLEFSDYLQGIILTQRNDDGAAIVHHESQQEAMLAGATLRDGQTPMDLILGTYEVWTRELQRIWPAIQQIAEMLLRGETVTDEVVRQTYEDALEAWLNSN